MKRFTILVIILLFTVVGTSVVFSRAFVTIGTGGVTGVY